MPEETVELTIQIAARPATVFKFLSDVDRFREWIGDATVSPEPGGDLKVRYPNGDVARGKFVELTPNRRVVFTWGYDHSANGMPPGSSIVTVDLLEIESGTLLTLRHEGIPADDPRRGHAQGWKHFFTRLADIAAKTQLHGRIQPLLECYTRAFNEPNEAARLPLIAQCWEPAAWYCDPMGRGKGRDELSRFIGAAHQMAPGVRLEITGKSQQTAEYLRFEWSLYVGAHRYSTGNSFGQLSLDGRFASLVGFGNT